MITSYNHNIKSNGNWNSKWIVKMKLWKIKINQNEIIIKQTQVTTSCNHNIKSNSGANSVEFQMISSPEWSVTDTPSLK